MQPVRVDVLAQLALTGLARPQVLPVPPADPEAYARRLLAQISEALSPTVWTAASAAFTVGVLRLHLIEVIMECRRHSLSRCDELDTAERWLEAGLRSLQPEILRPPAPTMKGGPA